MKDIKEANIKTKKINLVKKLSRFLLKFGIDIRRKVFKAIIDNLEAETVITDIKNQKKSYKTYNNAT